MFVLKNHSYGQNMFKVARMRNVLFAGIFLRIFLIVLFVPVLQQEWFAAFIDSFVSTPSWDPWQTWLDSGGSMEAFPYGPLMVIVFAIPSYIIGLFGVLQPGLWAIPFVILVCEMFILVLLFGGEKKVNLTAALAMWAFNPLLLFVCYVHGQLDIVPATFIFFACVLFWRNSFVWAGFVLGLAVAFKFSSIIVVPVVLLFLFRNDRFRGLWAKFCLSLLPGVLLALLPAFLFGYRSMVLGSPLFLAVFHYKFHFSALFPVLVAPVAITVLAFVLWKFTRANVQILFVFITLFLFVVPLVSPASPGWFLWSLPLLIFLVNQLTRRLQVFSYIFWSVETVLVFLTFSLANARDYMFWETANELVVKQSFIDLYYPLLLPLLSTLAFVVGIFFLYILYRHALKEFDMYQLSASPLSVSVAGDSGTGKDTLCRSLADVFGGTNTAFIMGDDYHLHERGDPQWGVYTHLDPAANDVPRLSRDFLRLLSGLPVWSRHYDHGRGRFTTARMLHRGELIVSSGLHVLASPEIVALSDLKVFLDMDEDLRIMLKAKRDISVRGYTVESVKKSIARRKVDGDKFISPQRNNADLVLCLVPESVIEDPFSKVEEVPSISVVAYFNSLSVAQEIAKTMRALTGVLVDVGYTALPAQVVLSVPNTEWLSAEDIGDTANYLISRSEELSLQGMVWEGGSVGVTQLFLVVALLEKRKLRGNLRIK